jgi:hypothetical protein
MIVTPLQGVLVLDVMKDHARLAFVIVSLGSSILLPVLLTNTPEIIPMRSAPASPFDLFKRQGCDCH